MPKTTRRAAATKNGTKGAAAAKRKRTIAHLPKATRTRLAKQANKEKAEKRS